MRTVAGQTATTGVAAVAGAVDFSHHSPTGKLTGTSDADKFVAEYSLEPHVAFAKLQVRFTDAGLQDINSDFAAAGGAEGGVRSEMETGIKNDSAHESNSGCNRGV
jgi:hypothetical protein